jgi:hypothetical protein
LPDPKDDHVLELSVASQVKNITTFNVKDFKRADLKDMKAVLDKVADREPLAGDEL